MEDMSAEDPATDKLFGDGEPATTPTPASGGKRRAPGKIVLVVEDSAPMRKLICAMVHRAGHQPLEAADGTVALDMVRGRNPRLVLLDVLMPGLSGIDTLKQLRMIPGHKTTPVVLLTSVRDPEVIREAGRYGVSDYLAKPTTTARLNEKLSKYLG